MAVGGRRRDVTTLTNGACTVSRWNLCEGLAVTWQTTEDGIEYCTRCGCIKETAYHAYDYFYAEDSPRLAVTGALGRRAELDAEHAYAYLSGASTLTHLAADMGLEPPYALITRPSARQPQPEHQGGL